LKKKNPLHLQQKLQEREKKENPEKEEKKKKEELKVKRKKRNPLLLPQLFILHWTNYQILLMMID